jgi:hypothetical protein
MVTELPVAIVATLGQYDGQFIIASLAAERRP